ncbi:MAG: site-2 protease family protein [Micromonosporaceae bacterium]
MKQSLRLGRVAGITVGVHWSVIVILALIAYILGASWLPAVIAHQPASAYWIMAIVGAVAFLASLFAHEMAHALVARRKGVTVHSITLWMLGGFTELGTDSRTPGAELQIALAGPVTSLVAGAAFGAAVFACDALGGPVVLTAALAWLAIMNGLLAVFNMLPGAPLDGGRVLRAALWRHYGDRVRADLAAARAGRYLGVAIAVAGIAQFVMWQDLGGIWLILIGWFLVVAANAESGAAQVKDALTGVRVADIMTADPDLAPAWHSPAAFIEHVARQSRQSVFPVVGFAGELVGVVSLDALARLRPRERDEFRLEQIAMDVPPLYRAAPEDPATSLLSRVPLGGELAAVVLSGGRVVGIVTSEDLRRALRMAPLRGAVRGSAAQHDPWPSERDLGVGRR